MPDVMRGYSLKEVAQKVGVVNATIIRWIETNKVKVPKRKNTQGHYFFTEADLKRFIEYKNRVTIVTPKKRPKKHGD
jgi:predicted site-specific integrase-resolvase